MKRSRPFHLIVIADGRTGIRRAIQGFVAIGISLSGADPCVLSFGL